MAADDDLFLGEDGSALATELDPAEFTSLRERVDMLERRVDLVETAEDEPWTHGDPGALDFLSQTRGSPGFVVDEAVARESSCIGYDLRGRHEADLVFSKGVVGALDKEQIDTFCPTIELREPTPKQRERLAAFREATAVCKQDPAVTGAAPGEHLGPWLACMERELRSRGQRL